MITEQDLQEAIAECQGTRNPNAGTCIKLAAYYIIKHNMYPDPDDENQTVVSSIYSYAPSPDKEDKSLIDYQSKTEFAELIDGKRSEDVWKIIDELMTVLQTVHPRLYDSVVRKLVDM